MSILTASRMAKMRMLACMIDHDAECDVDGEKADMDVEDGPKGVCL